MPSCICQDIPRSNCNTRCRFLPLGKGWQSSFQTMLQPDLGPPIAVGNPGLAHEGEAPAWPGFRQMRVANINKESDSVSSFILEPLDGQPLPVFESGQFVVLRLHLDPDKSPVFRSYSLSDLGSLRETEGVQSCVLISCREALSPTMNCPITRAKCASSARYRAITRSSLRLRVATIAQRSTSSIWSSPHFTPKLLWPTLRSPPSPLTITILCRSSVHQSEPGGHSSRTPIERFRRISTSRSTPTPSTIR